MKKIMEMLQNMKSKNEKKDNKGFSLVELIIVIAIMAILVGIVGTQVLPYINKSKEAKDLQIINSYGTAATTAYSSNAEKVTGNVTLDVYATHAAGSVDETLANDIKELTGYSTLKSFTDKMASKKGQDIAKIEIKIDIADTTTGSGASATTTKASKTITTQAYDKNNNPVFDKVVTQL